MRKIQKMTLMGFSGFLLCLSPYFSLLWAQDKPKGPPPAKVVAAAISSGKVAPQSEFIGTIFYQEMSDVASEVSGLVEEVRFEEGQRVNDQQILVRLSSDILKKRIRATVATHEQVLADLQKAEIDMRRNEKLFKNQSISERVYDENRFEVKRLEKQTESLQAEVERLELELDKSLIRSPFNGLVVKRHVDRGEWLSEGEPVAIIAKDDVVDIIVNLPERLVQHVKIGTHVRLTVGEQELSGKIITVVPRGDVATRTFPVKIRMPNTMSLIEGMTARVRLPSGKAVKTLLVPRDAVIPVFGRNVVFAVIDSKARMIPVEIIGYTGLTVGVSAQSLKDGMLVVVKGNERLRDGQMVITEK